MENLSQAFESLSDLKSFQPWELKKYLTLTDYLLSFRRVMMKNYFTLGHSDFNLKSFQKSNLS